MTIDFLIDFLSSVVYWFPPKPYVVSGFVDDFNTVLTLISSTPSKSAFGGARYQFHFAMGSYCICSYWW